MDGEALGVQRFPRGMDAETERRKLTINPAMVSRRSLLLTEQLNRKRYIK